MAVRIAHDEVAQAPWLGGEPSRDLEDDAELLVGVEQLVAHPLMLGEDELQLMPLTAFLSVLL